MFLALWDEQVVDTPWERRGYAWAGRVGLSLLALVLLAQPGWAQSKTGIAIAQSGDNVNITLDPSVVSDVSIRRNEGKMVIHIPKGTRSADSALQIDSALKQTRLVEEVDTPSGRVITVNSQQVYLITEELGNRKSEDAKPASVSKVAVSATSGAAPVPAAPHPPPKISPAKVTPSPTTGNSSEAKTEAPPATDKKTPAPSAKKPVPNPLTPEPVTVERPAAGAPPSVVEVVAPADLLDHPLDESDSEVMDGDSEQQALDLNDPELLPIDFMDVQRETARQTSSGLMIRMLASLLVVLALTVGFLKLLLPKLVARFPGFFENLRRQSPPSADWRGGKASKSVSAPEHHAPDQSMVRQAADEGEAHRYLTHLGHRDDQFQVITSTRLGKGKELHLVEIRGRQLVVATTPYTVSLIKDLTEDTGDDEMTDLVEPGTPLSGLLQNPAYACDTDEGLPADELSHDDEADWDQYYNPETMASSGSIESKRSEYKPVATRAYVDPPRPAVAPRQSEPSCDDTPAPAPPSPLSAGAKDPKEQVYLKYLDPAPSRTRGQSALMNARRPEIPSYTGDETVDAEEVVVLEDYDDTYSG